jgi:putative DNA primase/helicase
LTDEETAKVYALVLARKTEKPKETLAAPRAPMPAKAPVSGHDVLEKMFAARNGVAIQDLFNGNISQYDGDDSAADMALCCHLAFWTRCNEQEMDRLFRQSRLYRKKWDERHSSDGKTYGQMTINKAIAGCTEVYDPFKNIRTTEEHSPNEAVAAENSVFTDTFAATWFAGLYADRLRFDHTSGNWYLWDGKRWRPDITGRVYGMLVEAARRLLNQITPDWNSDKVKDLLKFVAKLESRNAIRDVLDLAKRAPGIAITNEALDSKRMLFNVQNGTINLSDGTLQPHAAENLITKISAAHYSADATAPKFKSFLNTIFDSNSNLIQYIARCAGLFLTGLTNEQILFFWFGTGANGKSVLINVLLMLLKDYAMKAPANMLMLDKGNSIPNDVARLRGSRLVICSEIQDGARLNESLVKDLTGGDRIAARFLHREFFEFQPEHKILIVGNHKPVVRGTDFGIWRRMHLTPFAITIPDSDRRPMDDLLNEFRAELPGILRWALDGLRQYQIMGLRPPVEITGAVAAYRSDSDILGHFLDECTKPDRTTEATFANLYKAYIGWCNTSGERPCSKRRLGSALDERGFPRQRDKHGEASIPGIKVVGREKDDTW